MQKQNALKDHGSWPFSKRDAKHRNTNIPWRPNKNGNSSNYIKNVDAQPRFESCNMLWMNKDMESCQWIHIIMVHTEWPW